MDKLKVVNYMVITSEYEYKKKSREDKVKKRLPTKQYNTYDIRSVQNQGVILNFRDYRFSQNCYLSGSTVVEVVEVIPTSSL